MSGLPAGRPPATAAGGRGGALDLVGALLASLAVFALGAAALPRAPEPGRALRSWYARRTDQRRAELARARLRLDPVLFEWIALAVPAAAFVAGWLYSPLVGAAGLVAGLMAPRALISFLTGRQRARSEREAPQLLQLLLANLGAGSTYLEALQAARRSISDRRLAEDLATVVSRFLLDVPLDRALREVRPNIVGRNLGLVWDNLTICVTQKIPTERARALLMDIAATVRFNVQLAGEVRAQTTGQRVQIWILALLVPAIYIYLRVVSPYFLNVLDDTWTGRYVLLPAAALLEVTGIWLSFRLSRVTV
jgi:Flp pilus assembly protein TadB